MNPSNPAYFHTDSLLYRVSTEAGDGGEPADDQCGGHSMRAAYLDAHHCHHRHLPPQTQEQETGEGAEREEVRYSSTRFS